MDWNLVVAGVNLLKDVAIPLFRAAKESPNPDVVVGIHRVLQSSKGTVMLISVTNMGNRPFSILQVFLERGEERFYACSIKNVETMITINGNCIRINFIADMFKVRIENGLDSAMNLNAFDFKVFLQPFQAETGWIALNIQPEEAVFGRLGLQISGESEPFFSH